jgi:hypothetical protein
MAGRGGRRPNSGRKAATPLAKWLAGKGPKPPELRAARPAHTGLGSAPAVVTGSGVLTGAVLVAQIADAYEVDDPLARALLQDVEAAQDRKVAIAALLNGPDGALVKLTAGGMTAAAVTALLVAERQAASALQAAIAGLQLDPGTPIVAWGSHAS